MKQLKAHALAAIFPLLNKGEFKQLVDDVKVRGIQIPILIKGDEIIDGRNRYAAAQELGLKPSDIPVEEYEGEDVVGEIIARNILRRHLTDDQRVALVAKLRTDTLAEEGKKAQKSGLRGAKGEKVAPKGEVSQRIAKEAKVSGGKGRQAVAVAKHSPDELEKVIEGKSKLAQAAKVASAKKAEKNKAAGKTPKAKVEVSLKDRVEKKFQKFMESFGVTEYREVRAIIRTLVAEADKNGQSAVAPKADKAADKK